MSSNVPNNDERDAVLAAYRRGFREAYAIAPDSLTSDHAGQIAARAVIIAREPGLDPTLAASRAVRIISRELLAGPVAFWESILRETG
jgi:hypothetical protein